MRDKEYIERGALIEMIEGHTSDTWGNGINRAWWSHAVMVKDNFVRMLKKAPSADVVEVRHGEWIDTGDFELDNIYSGWKCSLCGHIFCGNKTNYCSNCGAKMDGERKEQSDV